MMAAKNVFNRIYVQRLLLAASFLGISLNSVAISRGTDKARGNAVWDAAVSGKTTTVGGGNGSMTVTGPYKPSTVDATGNVLLKTGAPVPVNGLNVPVDVVGTVKKSDIAVAALAAAACMKGGVVGGVVCAAGTVAIPLALNWIATAGVQVTNTGTFQRKPAYACTVSPCFEYTGRFATPTYYTAAQICQVVMAGYNASGTTLTWSNPRFDGTGNTASEVCRFDQKWRDSGLANGTDGVSLSARTRTPDGNVAWQNATVEDATGLLNNSRITNADVVKELDLAGYSGTMPASALTVSGPASVQGPSTTSVTNNTTTNTTTDTSSTTNNYTYNGNTVTNTGTVTTGTSSTAVKNADGTTTTTAGPSRTTTTAPNDAAPTPQPETKTQCDLYPNSLGCAELDNPDADIPKENKTVTFTAEDPFGGGRCPADVYSRFGAIGGQTIKIIDWQTFCGMALPLRALVLALASIMAFFIIMPGGVRE